MTNKRSDDEKPIGYKNPPKSTRFKKGQSGNPRGKPPGRRRYAPVPNVFDQMVTIREEGVERRVTAVEALLLKLTKLGLEDNTAAARAAMNTIHDVRMIRAKSAQKKSPSLVVTTIGNSGSATLSLEYLRMGQRLDRYRETARMRLEPWLVQAALDRSNNRPYSIEEQKEIYDAHQNTPQSEMAQLVGLPEIVTRLGGHTDQGGRISARPTEALCEIAHIVKAVVQITRAHLWMNGRDADKTTWYAMCRCSMNDRVRFGNLLSLRALRVVEFDWTGF